MQDNEEKDKAAEERTAAAIERSARDASAKALAEWQSTANSNLENELLYKSDCLKLLAHPNFSVASLSPKAQAVLLSRVLSPDMRGVKGAHHLFGSYYAKPSCKKCHGTGSAGITKRIETENGGKEDFLTCMCIVRKMMRLIKEHKLSAPFSL